MAKENKYHIATTVSEEQYQALQKLETLRNPNVQCKSAVLRDCIEWAFWPLLSHYTGQPTSLPKELPNPNKTIIEGSQVNASK